MRQTYLKPANSLLLLALVGCLVALGGAVLEHANAQDPFGDPFGTMQSDGTNPFGDPAAAAGAGVFGAPAPPETPAATGPIPALDPDPVVRLLRSSPPKTPEQWSDALTWMVRIKRWDEVRRLLDELLAANWPIENKAALARAGGSSLWLRLRADEAALTDEQAKLVREILSAPSTLARDPSTIDKWIDQLASAKAGERRLAQFHLQDGSMAAVQRLVDRLLDGDATVPPTIVAATVVEFGRDGIEALKAASIVRDAERAGRVLLAIAPLPSREFNAELAAGLSSRVLSAETKKELAEALLKKFGRLPDEAAVLAHLTKKFDDALAEYQMRRTTAGAVNDYVWRPTADGSTIAWQEVPASQRSLEKLAQLAVHLENLPFTTQKDSIDAMAVLLQRAYQVKPTLNAGEVSSELLTPVQESHAADPGFWQAVYEQADQWQMHGAAVRSLQLLADNAVQAKFLAPLDFLSQQLNDPRPLIRYSALKAIAEIDPQHPYLGAERAVEVALEMTRLSTGPHSLVIGLQADLRQVASQLLTQGTGADVTQAISGQSALLALSGSQPIELIVIADRVSDMSIYELLQRLRKTENGQSLPIAVLTDSLYQHERRLVSDMPGVIASVLTHDQAQMDRVVSMLLDTLDTNPMSASERGEFTRVGGGFLATIASDRDRYSFYPLTDWGTQLLTADGGIPTEAHINIIAALGAAEGQSKLVSMAATPSFSEQERMAAARAFGRSVRRFGMLLNREMVMQSYELYNQLGPNDPVAAKALGMVLDITEAQAGKAEWPVGL